MSDIDKIARAICRERCAFMGEPACFEIIDNEGCLIQWPNPECDEPGCQALAMAAASVMTDLTDMEAS